VRAWHLGSNSLWIDEYNSLQTALVPIRGVPAEALRHDAFEPPVYFWLLHLVTSVFGRSETALRAPSLVVGVATIPAFWLLTMRLTDSVPTAHVAALLLALNPLHVWYSQEARPYALLLCVAVVAMLCLERALTGGRSRWWVAFGSLSGLTFLIHATGVMVFASGALWALLGDRRRLPRVALAGVVMLLIVLPFLITLAHAIGHATGTGSQPRPLTGLESAYTLFTFLAGYSLGPPVALIQASGARAMLVGTGYLGQTVAVGLVLLGIAILVVRAPVRCTLPFLLLLALPLGAPMLGSAVTGKAYNVRYALLALPGFLGLAAIGLTALRPISRWLSILVMLAVFVWADIRWFTVSDYFKEDSRGAMAVLSAALPAGATIAVAASYMRPLLQMYASTDASFTFIAVSDSSAVFRLRPQGLALTRVYHVSGGPQPFIRAFVRVNGEAVCRVSRAGYELLVAQLPSGECRPVVPSRISSPG
jgi:mannosyltransferase